MQHRHVCIVVAIRTGLVVGVGLWVLLLSAVRAAPADDNWPQFRGPRAGVVADDPALPETWSQTENVAWKIPVPGLGWSSPIVWGDLIVITSVVSDAPGQEPRRGFYDGHSSAEAPTAEHRWIVYGIDFHDGHVRWEHEVRRSAPPIARHGKNSYATETPVTDGQRIYVYFGGIGLFAFDMTGQPIWSMPIAPLETRHGWGTGASPVLHEDRIYIVQDNESQSFIAAFDTATGEEVWRVNRDEGSNWSTPFVWKNTVRTEIVTTGTDKVRSYGLDGELLWELTGMTWITSPTPFAAHGLLYMGSGYFSDAVRPVYAIRPGAIGDISLDNGRTRNEYVAWSDPKLGTYSTSALVYGDFYYSLFDRGFFLCHDARTGEVVYPRRRIARRATFTASPWAYNGRIFVLSEEGETFVIKAGPEFEVLGSNVLDEMTLATPAVARGSLIIRTASHLYRIAKGS